MCKINIFMNDLDKSTYRWLTGHGRKVDEDGAFNLGWDVGLIGYSNGDFSVTIYCTNHTIICDR